MDYTKHTDSDTMFYVFNMITRKRQEARGRQGKRGKGRRDKGKRTMKGRGWRKDGGRR